MIVFSSSIILYLPSALTLLGPTETGKTFSILENSADKELKEKISYILY